MAGAAVLPVGGRVAGARQASSASMSAKQSISSAASLAGRKGCVGRKGACRLAVSAGMGIGFSVGDNLPQKKIITPPERTLEQPANMYGLSVKQMGVLGLTGDTDDYRSSSEPDPEKLTARSHYRATPPSMNMATNTQMVMGGPPGQAPPDLPSLLLHSRICYLGMPLVPAVTELIIAELLWLNYDSPQKPLYLYINSTGSQTQQGEAVGFETEAYAIMDTLDYVRPEVHTVCIGTAFGNAAMLLASGTKGHRYSLPNASIMTCPPRINRASGNAKGIMIKANELENNTQTYTELLSEFTGKPAEEVRKDIGRTRYYTPNQAIEYGLIDKVISEGEKALDAKDYEGILRQQEMMDRKAAAAPGGG